jgi:hypothetical protein
MSADTSKTALIFRHTSAADYNAVLGKSFWRVEDVRVYLDLESKGAARNFLYRHQVRRFSRSYLTCRAYVDAAVQCDAARNQSQAAITRRRKHRARRSQKQPIKKGKIKK